MLKLTSQTSRVYVALPGPILTSEPMMRRHLDAAVHKRVQITIPCYDSN